MKLVYRCSHCAQQNEFDYPSGELETPEFVLASALDGYMPGISGGARPWIRHPCAPGTHGIAHLVAVIE